MASLLVFARRSDNTLRTDRQYMQPERGDVVDIVDADAFDWGRMVSLLGWWQEIVVPGVPAAKLSGLLAGSDGALENWTAWRHRTWRLDLDKLAEGQLPGGVWVIPIETLLGAAALKPESRAATGLAA